MYIFMIAGQHPARAAKAGLYFIGHEQYIRLFAKLFRGT